MQPKSTEQLVVETTAKALVLGVTAVVSFVASRAASGYASELIDLVTHRKTGPPRRALTTADRPF